MLQQLNHKIFLRNADYEDYFDTEWEFTKFGTNYFKDISSSDKYFTIIASDDDKPIGYLNGYERVFEYRKDKGSRVGEIENVGVLPKYQRRGVGLKLVSEFKRWCKKKDIALLFVNIYAKNEAALNFYKKLGLDAFDINLEGEI